MVYEDILKFPELKKFAEEKLEDYNMEPGVIPMSLVLFRDAIEHSTQNSCGLGFFNFKSTIMRRWSCVDLHVLVKFGNSIWSKYFVCKASSYRNRQSK